jgi:hypothetical protein
VTHSPDTGRLDPQELGHLGSATVGQVKLRARLELDEGIAKQAGHSCRDEDIDSHGGLLCCRPHIYTLQSIRVMGGNGGAAPRLVVLGAADLQGFCDPWAA